MKLVSRHGESDWVSVAAALGSGRTAKAARTKYNSLSQERRYFVEEIVGEGVDENGHPAYCARPSVATAIGRSRPGQLGLSVDAPGMHLQW